MSSSLYVTVTGKQGFGYDDLNLLLKTFPIDKPITFGSHLQTALWQAVFIIINYLTSVVILIVQETSEL